MGARRGSSVQDEHYGDYMGQYYPTPIGQWFASSGSERGVLLSTGVHPLGKPRRGRPGRSQHCQRFPSRQDLPLTKSLAVAPTGATWGHLCDAVIAGVGADRR